LEVADTDKEKEEKVALPVYDRLVNATVEQVNAMIAQGYTPWCVTVQHGERRRQGGNFVVQEEAIVYHFLRKKVKE
jgi:hypothetical protein